MKDTVKETFTVTELNALRNDLLQGGMVDSREAAELLQVFLMGRGFGVSPEAALARPHLIRRLARTSPPEFLRKAVTRRW